METLMKADIFFFVTTVAVIAVAICLVYALYHVIRILRNVDEISSDVRAESELVREDIHELRSNIRKDGARVKHVMNFFERLTGKKPHARTREEKK